MPHAALQTILGLLDMEQYHQCVQYLKKEMNELIDQVKFFILSPQYRLHRLFKAPHFEAQDNR